MSAQGGATERAKRVGVVLEVAYRNAGQFLVSYCTNLSRGGLFVATPTPSNIGTVISVALRIPGRASPIRLDASVRWVRPKPTEDGPSGMGLAFEGIDQMLGDHIDRLVTHAAPLRIAIIGRADHARRHLDALIRSLLTCDTLQLELEPNVLASLDRPDLVIVDVDGDAETALQMLETVADRGWSALALCSARKVEVRQRALAHARVIPTPVDSQELQTRVLEALGEVEASSGSRGG